MTDGSPDVVTFLFTDLERSTALWERNPVAMRSAIEAHNADMARVFGGNDALLVKYTGDGAMAAFATVSQALRAALDAQRSLESHEIEDIGPLRARMALHVAVVGDIEHGCFEADGDYLGPALNRCARLMATAHGGQILLSEAAALAVDDGDELGIDLRDLGRHRLRDLADREHVYQVVHPDLWTDFPPLRSVDAYPGNLPKQATSFVGRGRELDEIARLVEQTRIVTLAGVGGVGKTRLAVHTAARLIHRYEHGAWLVDLTPISDPELVPATLASALGIRERHGETITETICAHLRERSLVLVVDNCEHLIESSSELIRSIHEAAPGVRCIATSREPLRVPGEQIWRVPVLAVPEADQVSTVEEAAGFEAVQLFIDRARSADHTFALDDSNVDAVVALCRRLDGIPLAIELAAVRSGVLSPPEILRRLDSRFSLLTEGNRTEASHHQTLQRAIDWSHELLADRERRLFRRLSVFHGGWTLPDAEAVGCDAGVQEGEVLELLAGLANKSMIVVAKGDTGTRYRLLESLREYALERLRDAGEEAAYRERHARRFYELTTALHLDLRGPGQADAYETIQRELDNIRASFDWFVSAGEAEQALHLVRVLRTFLAEHLTTEGFQRAIDAVAVADDVPPEARASGLADAAWIGFIGQRDEAPSLALQSIETSEAAGLPPDPEALLPLGLVSLYEGQLERSLAYFERATQVSRDTDDRYEIASGQTGVCFLRAMLGDIDGAIRAGEEATDLGRELGYDTQIAGGLAALGFAYGAVDAEKSVVMLEESLALKDDTTYSAVARVLLAHLNVLLGHLPPALEGFRRVLEVHLTFGDTFFVPMSLEGMATVFALLGRSRSAARLLGASETVRHKLDLPGLEIETALRAGAEAMVEAALDAETLTAESTTGRNLTMDETIRFALGESDELLPVIDLRDSTGSPASDAPSEASS